MPFQTTRWKISDGEFFNSAIGLLYFQAAQPPPVQTDSEQLFGPEQSLLVCTKREQGYYFH